MPSGSVFAQHKHRAGNVLVKLFQKLAQVEGAKPSSPSAEGETPHTAFSFVSFSLAPFSAKRKAAKEFLCVAVSIPKFVTPLFLLPVGGTK